MSERSFPDLSTSLGDLLRQIPSGRVTTFGALARALGDIKAAAWVGVCLKQPEFREQFPWQRVVLVGGLLPGPSEQSQKLQQQLLQAEQVRVNAGKVVLQEEVFTNFQSEQPLRQLQQEQSQAVKLLKSSGLKPDWKTVAGLDLAFPSPEMAQVAYVECDRETGNPLWQFSLRCPCQFPYIPGYLAYRELPCYLQLLKQVQTRRPLADVLMLDGSGRIHPRQFGIACHLGVLLNWPTLGVSKKCLYGTVDQQQGEPGRHPVYAPDRQLLGYALQKDFRQKPVYVSAGQFCSAEQAYELAQACWQSHRLPEPTYLADRLSRQPLSDNSISDSPINGN